MGRGTIGIIRQISQDTQDILEVIPNVDADDANTIRFLDKVWEVYRKYTGVQLANLTHEEGSPWHQVWHNGDNNAQHRVAIDDSTIRNHYQNLSTERRSYTTAYSSIKIKGPEEEPEQEPNSKTRKQ